MLEKKKKIDRSTLAKSVQHFQNPFDNSWRLEAVNYYHKAFHLGCCSSPRSASG